MKLFAKETHISGKKTLVAFTLVEVLVVISIIGVLVALLMPAVQMARESARRSSCANNLKQIGLAVKLHTDAHEIFPTGGWGSDWIGDPSKGFGTKQPGGWIYNILPYLEQQNLRDLGTGSSGNDKDQALIKLMGQPLEVFNCPSRRLPRAYPYRGPTTLQNLNLPVPEKVAKADYVINSRISYERSEIIIAEIQLASGMSKTLMAGEKSLSRQNYTDGQGNGDGLCMYMGHSSDISREVSSSPVVDSEGNGSSFGGPHPGGCNVVYCDGSVHFINEDQELEVGQN